EWRWPPLLPQSLIIALTDFQAVNRRKLPIKLYWLSTYSCFWGNPLQNQRPRSTPSHCRTQAQTSTQLRRGRRIFPNNLGTTTLHDMQRIQIALVTQIFWQVLDRIPYGLQVFHGAARTSHGTGCPYYRVDRSSDQIANAIRAALSLGVHHFLEILGMRSIGQRVYQSDISYQRLNSLSTVKQFLEAQSLVVILLGFDLEQTCI